MRYTCSLCGGKLKDGICTECGMNNQKSDEMYRNRLNRSKYDHANMESMSHVHTEQGVRQYKEPVQNRNRNPAKTKEATWGQKSGTGSFQSTAFKNIKGYASASTGRNKQSSKLVVGIVIIFLVIMLLAMIGVSVFTSFYKTTTGENAVADYDYDEIREQLPQEGEYWNSELSAGMYMVGIDIPEGEYTLTGSEGSSFEVHDNVHSIYRQESFGTEEYEIEKAEGIPLFTGALVCVDGMSPVSFASENAQIRDLKERIANPVGETVEVSSTMTAGIDFPAGTYDIQAVGEDFGYVTYEICYKNPYSNEEQNYYSFGVMLEKNPTSEYPAYCSLYRNVVLPEGAVVDSEGYLCRLVPSQGIVSEDYEKFYENMY